MKLCSVTIWIFFMLILCAPESLAQEDSVEIFHRETEDGVHYFAKNTNRYPVTVELDLELENLKADRTLPAIRVVPPFSTVNMVRLIINEASKAWNFRSKYRYYMGDVFARHQDAFAYRLPFAKGETFRIEQGFGGSFSHQGDLQHAIDINMPEGSPVYAARGGMVIQLEEGNTKGGPSEEMMEFANFVTILHEDGTYADYSHLMFNGVTVQPGQVVRMGQQIGYSGNTGFSTGPHLHFVVKKAKRGGGFISIPVKFVTRNGIQLLEEGQSYIGY